MPNTISKPQINVLRKNKNILNSRLTERFGCSNIYRNKKCPKIFDSLSEFEQKQLLKNLKAEYSLIFFDYFASKDSINTKIEEFLREAFDISLPINKIVEIHLELIDNLERQLVFEGLHVEYLSDFRLTLIDVIAHLGELYRSGYVKKNISLKQNNIKA